jgi:hypothetical protein
MIDHCHGHHTAQGSKRIAVLLLGDFRHHDDLGLTLMDSRTAGKSTFSARSSRSPPAQPLSNRASQDKAIKIPGRRGNNCNNRSRDNRCLFHYDAPSSIHDSTVIQIGRFL